MRLFCAWNLAFIGIIASIIVLSGPSLATPHNAFADAAQITTTHCQLWQRQLHHYPPAISLEDYRNMLGRQLDSDDADALYFTTFGIADFTFLLGDWRAVATRKQRQSFNQLMFQTLEPYWKHAPEPQEASCLMEVTLSQRPTPEDAELPAPRLFHAAAYTTLLGIPLTYHLEQELNGWDIINIQIGAIDLQAEYVPVIAKTLKTEGFGGLNAVVK